MRLMAMDMSRASNSVFIGLSVLMWGTSALFHTNMRMNELMTMTNTRMVSAYRNSSVDFAVVRSLNIFNTCTY